MVGGRVGENADQRVHPTLDDPAVATLSEVVGGPMGARGSRHPWWTPVRVLLAVTAICFAIGMARQAPCLDDPSRNYSAMCYSDVPYLFGARGFAELTWPYTDDPGVRQRFDPMEYPVGISYLAWGTAWATHWLTGSPDVSQRYGLSVDEVNQQPSVARERHVFVALTALEMAVAALLTTWLLAGVSRHRPWDAALVAAAPVLVLASFINWDVLPMALIAGALWAWSRGRPVLTGVLIGLGTATKLYPLFLLGGLLVICLRDRRLRDLALATGASVLTWLAVNAPAYLTGPESWRAFWTFNSERGADLGSVWLIATGTIGDGLELRTINVWSAILFVDWCIAVLIIGLVAPRTPRLAQLGFLVVAGFLLVNKVYSPQYVLWLLPLAALARPRWRDQLIWQSTEVFYFLAVWWYLGGVLDPPGGGTAGTYWIAIVLRMLGELYLVVVVVRDILSPDHDPVRAPAGRPDRDTSDQGSSAAQTTSTRSNVVAV